MQLVMLSQWISHLSLPPSLLLFVHSLLLFSYRYVVTITSRRLPSPQYVLFSQEEARDESGWKESSREAKVSMERRSGRGHAGVRTPQSHERLKWGRKSHVADTVAGGNNTQKKNKKKRVSVVEHTVSRPLPVWEEEKNRPQRGN